MITINRDSGLMLFPFSAEVINSRIREVLISDNPEVNEIINYIVENNGKMVRPRLVMLSSAFYECDSNIVRDVAVAVELIHMASLVHDDIIDRSLLRRGRQSVNSLWGNQVSVLSGDYLFAAAFQIVNWYGLKAIMESITEAIMTMCAGEIKQMSMAYQTVITEEQYLVKTFEKTACLFAASCQIGALTGAMPADNVQHIKNFGMYLGLAYQIMDDVLDFVSEANLLGKPVGNDLIQGNITLPIIYALNEPEVGPWLCNVIETRKFSKSKLQKVSQILTEIGAIEYATAKSHYFLDKAVEHLCCLPSGAARSELENLSFYLINDYFEKLQLAGRDKKQGAFD